MTTQMFWAAAIPVIFGFAIHKLYALWKRSVASSNTPPKLSLKFWLHDNWLSTILHMALMIGAVVGTPAALDFVQGYKHTPKQVLDVVEALPLKLIYFGLGIVTAYPLTQLDKGWRKARRRIARMVPK